MGHRYYQLQYHVLSSIQRVSPIQVSWLPTPIYAARLLCNLGSSANVFQSYITFPRVEVQLPL